MNHDIINSITTAIGCQQCEASLDDSPSDDFCSADCQAAWFAERAKPLTDYTEPVNEPEYVDNQRELHSRETCGACAEGRLCRFDPLAAVIGQMRGQYGSVGYIDETAFQDHEAHNRVLGGQIFTAPVGTPFDATAWEPLGFLNPPDPDAARAAEAPVSGFLTPDVLRRAARRLQRHGSLSPAAQAVHHLVLNGGLPTHMLFEHVPEDSEFARRLRDAAAAIPALQPMPAVSLSFRAVDVDTDAIGRYLFDGAMPVRPTPEAGRRRRASGGSIPRPARVDPPDVRVYIGPGMALLPPELVDHIARVMAQFGQVMAQAWGQIAPAVEQVARMLPELEPDDPRERALWRRRNRNTGPAARNARAPRAINPHRRPR